MPPRTDRVLLLRRFAYGETSLVVQALSRRYGRVHLIAKGAYRPKARFYAALDLFDTLELEWQHSPGRELMNLRAAGIATRRHRIAFDLARFRAGATVLELTSTAAHAGQPSPELFDLAEGGLDALAAEPRSPELALVVFELRFLHNLGLAPALLACAACGGPAPAVPGPGPRRAAFSAGAGGRLCGACAEEARGAGRRVGTLPVVVLERTAELTETPDDELTGRELPADELDRVRDLVSRFLEYHLEGRPKTYRRFLSVPNRNRPTA